MPENSILDDLYVTTVAEEMQEKTLEILALISGLSSSSGLSGGFELSLAA